MKSLLCLCALVACVAADGYGGGYGSKGRGGYGITSYHGRYNGKCGRDGFYYQDDNSFIVCSNGNSYTQRCAPGSRNSGYGRYQHGHAYTYNDFCDVNLVDYGYGVRHGGYGGGHGGGYGGGRQGIGYGHQGGYGDGYGYGPNRGYY